MRDIDIRPILRSTLLKKYYEDSASKVVEEMKIPAANARIDLAVINGSLHGYEIKSASDTLVRLPNQLISYAYIFDYLTIVTEDKYYQKIIEIVPTWVGISLCSVNKGQSKIRTVRKPKKNPDRNGFYIAKLLWHNELEDVLMANEIKFKKKSRNWVLCNTLASNMDISKLSSAVREKIKKREAWKS
jgi:hypothetical protein